MKKSQYIYPLLFIILVNIVYYLWVIKLFPGFISDDFELFAYISKNADIPICLDPKTSFFLFLRPISYFTFWLDYTLLKENYFIMKLESLTLHLVTLSVIYIILIKLSELFNIKFKRNIAIILLLIFSFHSDALFWLTWIANRTEILMLLFYALAVLMIINFLRTNKNVFLLFYIIFFTLSVAAKQTGLHLPLLLVYLIILNNKKDYIKIKDKSKIYLYIGFTVLLMVLIIIINSIYVGQTEIALTNIWKKPFALMGVLFYVIFPLYQQSIYSFFVLNKVYAVVLLLSGIFFLIYKKINIYNLLYIIIFLIIISFPRLAGAGGGRINSIYLFWAVIFFYFIIKDEQKIVNGLLTVLVFIYFFANIYKSFSTIYFINNYEKKVELLKEKNKELNFKLFILVNDEALVYQYYYLMHNKFGKDTVNLYSNIYLATDLTDPDKFTSLQKDIKVNINKDTITIKTINDKKYLYNKKDRLKDDKLKLIKSEKAINERGYYKMEYKLNDNIIKDKYKFVYFDGLAWQVLN